MFSLVYFTFVVLLSHYYSALSFVIEPNYGVSNAKYHTKGQDEIRAKFLIWLKLYQMNICSLSKKDQESYFQNMNKE